MTTRYFVTRAGEREMGAKSGRLPATQTQVFRPPCSHFPAFSDTFLCMCVLIVAPISALLRIYWAQTPVHASMETCLRF